MRIIVVQLFIVLGLNISGFAADHYVCAGAAGTGDGSTWTNAFTDFATGAGHANPSSLVRGDTYWVAAGSYASSGVVFNTPDSGASVITIQAATDAVHGSSSAGWTNGGTGTCHQGQATFRALVQFLTDYWTLNGAYRSTSTGHPWLDWRSGYGFLINNNAGGGTPYSVVGGILAGDNAYGTTVNHITLKYLEISGSHDTTGSVTDGCVYMQSGPTAQQSPYIGYSWCHDTGNFLWEIAGGNNLTIEYTWGQNSLSGAVHGEGYKLTCAGYAASNYNIRYNYIENVSGTAYIATPCNTDIHPSNWAIYGNVFFTNLAEGNHSGGYGAGNGAIALWNFLNWTGYLYIYNNTFSTLNPSGGGQCDIELDINNQGAAMGTVIIQNNVWYNCATAVNPAVCPTGGCTSFTDNYRSYFDTSTSDSDPHKQVASSNPFTNVSSTVNADNFALVSVTSAWFSLSSPYNIDLLGNTRTSSRGAFQFGAGLSPPTGLTLLVQ